LSTIDLFAGRDSSLIERLHVLDLTNALDSSHRYILDRHLNANGHRIVADTVMQTIQRLERTH
jgi:hypothetical protein